VYIIIIITVLLSMNNYKQQLSLSLQTVNIFICLSDWMINAYILLYLTARAVNGF